MYGMGGLIKKVCFNNYLTISNKLLTCFFKSSSVYAKIKFYKEKLSPHPHVLSALGLEKTNPLPFKPPEKSRVVPIK